MKLLKCSCMFTQIFGGKFLESILITVGCLFQPTLPVQNVAIFQQLVQQNKPEEIHDSVVATGTFCACHKHETSLTNEVHNNFK